MSFELVVIGTSAGGTNALKLLLSALRPDFTLPIVIAQHRDSHSGEQQCKLLQRHSARPVREPYDKDVVEPSQVYIAPADYHLAVERTGFALSIDPPVDYARPSIDVLFESAADNFADGVIAVLMTGASRDGSRGLRRIKERGGLAIVQDPDTSESATMPRAGIEATTVDHVVLLAEIAPLLARLGQSVQT